MTLEEQLKKEFLKAIQEIKPPILFGPKWVRSFPDARRPYFQFLGAPKIAKATGKDVLRVADRLLAQVDLKGLGLTAEIAPDGVITLRKGEPRPKPPGKAGGALPPPRGEDAGAEQEQ